MSGNEEKRTEFVNLRLTPSEYAHLQVVAKSYNKPVGEIVRLSTFGELERLEMRRSMQKHRPKRLDDEQFEKLHTDVQAVEKYVTDIYRAMVHVDNNINQIAKVANTTKTVDARAVSQINKDVSSLKKIVKNVRENFSKDVIKFWRRLM